MKNEFDELAESEQQTQGTAQHHIVALRVNARDVDVDFTPINKLESRSLPAFHCPRKIVKTTHAIREKCAAAGNQYRVI